MPTPPPLVLGLIVVVSWASSFPYIQLALESGVDPISLGSLRCTIAFISLLPILFFKKGHFPLPKIKDLFRIFITGALGFGLYSYLLNAGEQTVSAGVTSLLMASTPIFAAIIASIITDERLSMFAWVGSSVAFAGVAVVSLMSGQQISAGRGVALLVGAAFINGLYAVLQRPVINKFGGFRGVLYLIGSGAISLLPWLANGIKEVYHGPSSALFDVLWLSIVPTVIGYACWGMLIGAIGPSKGGMFMYAIAPVALLLSWALLGQKPSISILFGGSVIILGVCFTRLQIKHFRFLQKPA